MSEITSLRKSSSVESEVGSTTARLVVTFKTELVDGRRFPSFEHAEHETPDWIGFYSEERLHEELGDLPPAEYEELNINKDNSRNLAAG